MRERGGVTLVLNGSKILTT